MPGSWAMPNGGIMPAFPGFILRVLEWPGRAHMIKTLSCNDGTYRHSDLHHPRVAISRACNHHPVPAFRTPVCPPMDWCSRTFMPLPRVENLGPKHEPVRPNRDACSSAQASWAGAILTCGAKAARFLRPMAADP